MAGWRFRRGWADSEIDGGEGIVFFGQWRMGCGPELSDHSTVWGRESKTLYPHRTDKATLPLRLPYSQPAKLTKLIKLIKLTKLIKLPKLTKLIKLPTSHE